MSGMPLCDLQGQCSPCLAAADCPSGSQCSLGAVGGAFGPNFCIECMSSADCSASKPFCDDSLHRCAECAQNSDCTGKGAKTLCRYPSFNSLDPARCVECSYDTDCASGLHCTMDGDCTK